MFPSSLCLVEAVVTVRSQIFLGIFLIFKNLLELSLAMWFLMGGGEEICDPKAF